MPQLQGTAGTYEQTTAATAHTLNLPTGYADGDLLMAFIATDNTAGNNAEVTAFSGWTLIADSDEMDVTTETYIAAYYRVASSPDGADYTIANAAESSAIVYAVRNHNASTNAPDMTGFNEVTTGNDLNCPSHTPGPGNDAYLWFAATTYWSANRNVSTWPASYDDPGENTETSNNDGGNLAVTTRELTATSEDPGAITLSNTAFGWVGTIAVQDGTEGGGAAANPKGPLGHPLHGPFGGPV